MSQREPVRRTAKAEGSRGKADLHMHSLASDGLNSPQEILDYVEEFTDLDVIAITDHDFFDGAAEALEIHARGHYSFDLVAGEEITTRSGHLLALDIKKPVRMYMSLEKSIYAIREQGGVVVVPHPLVWFSAGLSQHAMTRIMHSHDPVLSFDAVETFNPSFAGRSMHDAVASMNRTVWRLPSLGGSDSHHLHTIGTGRTTFPGHTWRDLRRAITDGATEGEGEFWDAHDHYSIAVPQAWRSLVLLPGKRVREIAGYIGADWEERHGHRNGSKV